MNLRRVKKTGLSRGALPNTLVSVRVDKANRDELDDFHNNLIYPESEGAFLDEMPGKRGR